MGFEGAEEGTCPVVGAVLEEVADGHRACGARGGGDDSSEVHTASLEILASCGAMRFHEDTMGLMDMCAPLLNSWMKNVSKMRLA